MKRNRLFVLAGLLILSALFWGTVASAQEGDGGAYELGARLYAENCAVCHGPNGEGRVGATLAKDWPSIRPELVTKDTIEKGISGSPMPPWSQTNGGPLTDSEIDALVFFILSWQTGGPPGTPFVLPSPTPVDVTPLPGEPGDPVQGARLYADNCVVCHGENGEGRIGATLAKDWPSIRPDLLIRSTIAGGVEDTYMPAWSQENGGPLTPQEIDHLVAFIKGWAVLETIQEPTPTAESPSMLAGWPGVLLTIGLFIAFVVFAVWLQTRGARKQDQ